MPEANPRCKRWGVILDNGYGTVGAARNSNSIENSMNVQPSHVVRRRKMMLNCLSYLFYLGSELTIIETGRPCHLVCSRGFHRRHHHLLTYLADVYRLLPVSETWSETDFAVQGRKVVLVPFRLTDR